MKQKNYEFLKWFLRFSYVTLLLVVESLGFYYFWMTEYVKEVYLDPFYFWGDIYLTILYAMFLFLFMNVFGGLKLGYLKRRSTTYTQLLSTLCANAVSFLLIILLVRSVPTILPLIKLTVLDMIAVVAVTLISEWIFYEAFPARRLLLIYGNDENEQIEDKMEDRNDRFVVVAKMSASESFAKLEEEIMKYDGVVLSDVHSDKRNLLLKFCYGNAIRVYMTPKLSDVMIRSAEMLHIFDSPLLLARNYGLTTFDQFWKRVVDILISATLILLSLPIMLIVAICIKVYDGGPVLFKQTRLTRNYKEFSMYKFRSMVTNAEKEGECVLASKNDDRVTPIGEILRKTRLDELPQLFNVLLGDMSMVGPRPERPFFAEKYQQNMPEFAFRLDVKAGLTGYAQVYGKYNTSPYDKLKMDLMYIENYSLWQDLKIMLMTLKVVFMKASAEGVDEG